MKLAAFSEPFGRRIKNVVESFEPPGIGQPVGNKATILSGYSTPMEITAAWEQDADDEVWKCKAKRLWKSGGKYQTRDNATEITLYAPCDNNTPTPAIGDKVFAIYRGVWEMVGGVGNGGSPNIYAIVMEAIHCPSDPTGFDPNDGEDYDTMGTIKIIGKEYDAENPVYDKCTCFELAGKNDPNPEQLLKGTQIEVIKAGQYDNPDYDSENPTDPPTPEKLDWYLAVETEGIYQGTLGADLTSDGTSTITVLDYDENEIEMTVHPVSLFDANKITGNTPIIATRISGLLVVTNSVCPVPL